MQLSRDDFEQGLTAWLNKNVAEKKSTAALRHIDPKQWQAKREPFTGHLWAERLDKVVIGQRGPAIHTATDCDEDQEDYIEEVDDVAVDVGYEEAGLSGNSIIYVDLYVAYSPVYRVPVLYFRARLQDGTIVGLEDLLATSFFHVTMSEYPLTALEESTNQASIDQAHFPTISQGDHPQTGLPCFYLHPCETSAALEDILAAAQGKAVSPLQMIETWFMLVSTLLDIR